MGKRNVLLFLGSFQTGGAEGQILLLARLLKENGRYQPHLACFEKSGVLLGEAERLGPEEIGEFPLRSFHDGNTLRQLGRFAGFLRKRRIDVVHTEGFYTNVFGMVGSAMARVPARVAFRGETGGWRTPRQDFLERMAFRLAHTVHANSAAVKRHLLRAGVPEQNITLIHNGIDIARVSPPPDLSREDMLERLSLPPNRRFVTIVANMHHPVKDLPTFLRAARQIRAEVPDAAFVLAGEGRMRDDLLRLAVHLGLEGDAFFIGRCDRIAELLAVSDACALSSTAEGFSNAILEYMGAARPVVATNVGGAREAVVDGETGYLVEAGDNERLADRLISLLRDPARARTMGQRGRSVVEQRFSTEAQLRNTERLYDTLLARKA